ncbi:MAG: GNAT family protein [Eubacteriales bacterium]|nr:GNAT family protein [Eubacteriales bacterium]
MRYFRKIVGERLYLSPFSADDSEICTQWARWMNDRTVADHFGGHHQLVSLAGAKKPLEELKGYRFAMVLLDGDTLIGQISLHDIDHVHRNAFLGIVIGEEKHRGKGYGAEAIRLILDYGFHTLNLHSVMLSVPADNPAGIACYKKVGFREAGRRREWVFKNGKYVDKIYMDMLAREFGEVGPSP